MARLTIGIPTQGKRPDLLERAIATALLQSSPAAVLVSDQTGDAEEIVSRFAERGVRYHRSQSTCLWENWTAAAHNANTELFAWCQDDDVLGPHFVKRIQQGMDALPGCVLWMGRLGVSLVGGLANWWMSTGPMVPMDLLYGTSTEVHPETIAAASHFTSFALSPAVAFRLNQASCDAVARVPKDCDLYAERLILAELSRLGKSIADPALVGYWCIHDGNESRKQIAAGGVHPQYCAMAARLHDMLEAAPGWEGHLAGWALMQNPDTVNHWLTETARHRGGSPSFDRAWDVMAAAVRRPVPGPAGPMPPVETAQDPAPKRAERRVRRKK
jgi:hypothetical protein